MRLVPRCSFLTPKKSSFFRAAIALGLAAAFASASSCAWIGDQLDPMWDSGSGLPKPYWPAMPLADKTFIFSTDGRLMDIVYLSLGCVNGACSDTRRSIALHGRVFTSTPLGANGKGPLPTTSQDAAVAASSPQTASDAAAAPKENPDSSELLVRMEPKTLASGEAVFVVSAARAAGSSSWKYDKTLPVSRLAEAPPVVLGVVRPDSLILIDVFGQNKALDSWREPQAREELKRRGIALPASPPDPEERPQDKKNLSPIRKRDFFALFFQGPPTPSEDVFLKERPAPP